MPRFETAAAAHAGGHRPPIAASMRWQGLDHQRRVSRCVSLWCVVELSEVAFTSQAARVREPHGGTPHERVVRGRLRTSCTNVGLVAEGRRSRQGDPVGCARADDSRRRDALGASLGP